MTRLSIMTHINDSDEDDIAVTGAGVGEVVDNADSRCSGGWL